VKLLLITALVTIVNIYIPQNVDNAQIDTLHVQIYDQLDTDLDSALVVSKQTLAYSKDNDYTWGEANSLYLIGYIHKQKKNLTTAIIYYLKANRILEALDDDRSIKTRVKLMTNCGIILKNHFWYEQALKHFDEGIILATERGMDKRLLKPIENQLIIDQMNNAG